MRRDGNRGTLQKGPRLPGLLRAWFGWNSLSRRLNACSAGGGALGVRLHDALPKTAGETRQGGPSGPRLAACIISPVGIWLLKVRPPASIDRSMNIHDDGAQWTDHQRQGEPHSRRVAAVPRVGRMLAGQGGRTGAYPEGT